MIRNRIKLAIAATGIALALTGCTDISVGICAIGAVLILAEHSVWGGVMVVFGLLLTL